MGSFCPNYKINELIIYRGAICNDTEEWWKIWRGIDLLFQNRHEEFDKFWLEHLSLKTVHFNGLVLTKDIMFVRKKYRGVIFHETREWCKILRKTDLWFRKWHEELGKISPKCTKVSKLGLLLGPLVRIRKCMSLKFTGELFYGN